jgi:TldD protein
MATNAELDQVYDIFEKVGSILDGKVEYWDVLYDSQSSCSISKDNVDERVSTPELKGVLLRAFKDGVWYTSSSHKVDKRAIVKLAEVLVKPIQKPGRIIKLNPLNANKIDKALPAKKDPTHTPLEQKLDHVRQFHKVASSLDKRVINTRIAYGDSLIERAFANSEGSLMHQSIPRIRITILPIAREGDRIETDYISRGRTAGFEFIEGLDVEGLCKKAVGGSIELLGAKTPPSGESTIIADPGMAGMIAHESFGHGLEADQVIRDRSYLASLVGKKVASERATIIDSSILAGGWGSYVFDDEGVLARENMILEKGVLKGFLHDRLTSSALGASPTSNCRVESYLTKHFVRMTNTYFAPGDMTLDELMEPIKRGVMLVHASFGMEDPLGGGIQCTSNKGYMIEKGEVGAPLTSISLAGRVLDLLKNIDGASNDFDMSVGTCGKGSEDFVPAGDGGCYLRINKAIISGG